MHKENDNVKGKIKHCIRRPRETVILESTGKVKRGKNLSDLDTKQVTPLYRTKHYFSLSLGITLYLNFQL